MTERFSGKVAIVTGGVSGIGAKITERLAAEGARVVAVDINEELVAEAGRAYGPQVSGERADVTDEDAFASVVARTVEQHGTLDLMFNVAGGSRAGSLTEISYEDWDFTVRLNLHSAFLGTRLAARQFLAEGKAGAIVNVASLNSVVPMFLGVGYTASKAGAVMLTKQAALELGEHGIRVNAVSPGLVATPLTQGLRSIPGVDEAYFERIPFRRPAEPEEIAAAAVFLASDDASYISGDNLIVDGAWATTGYPDLRPFLG
ncbi:SDR family NAD(P)-dependent oxidoreductase [Sediminivirga luteola]|uniref:3-oxoacyl-ACP reductase n=1 Tax=Sediminivirga luteola TaxID=1774748 RepID=A0A8J2XID6_9MICO|nr:SDR family NAD(P)-dependent oxidoreductase [Sediminivirga luteola]MCI2264777.1 SDR family oxidoreductase [Sediminivirga luteola]GGA16523.1 3-oxoacyl-ACP reductase [Sediminivirga luteola]